MSTFAPQRIVVAVDMSPLSKVALQAATILADTYDASLKVVMAFESDAPIEFTSDQVEALARQEQRNRVALERELRQWVDAGIPKTTELVVVAGETVPAILNAAIGSDLIVIGSHGRSGLSLARLGSVSEGVIRNSQIPILSVQPCVPSAAVCINHILCPVNLTPLSQSALEIAFSLASHLQSRLTVMATEEGEEILADKVHATCSQIRSEHGTQCSLNTVIRKGQAADEIMAVAHEQQNDLIVLGAQRKGSLAEAVFGSTTEKLLRHAHTSILVVPNITG
jgi:nucleotide-binding universal stress UspA family protein